MSRAARNRRATLPVSRNIIGPSTPNRDTRIPLTSLTVVEMTARPIRKGRCPQKVGIYGRTSMFYKTSATIDKSWDATVSTHGNVR